MAGPTASILLETIPSEQTWIAIKKVIQRISDKVEGNDFWVRSTTFINGGIAVVDGRPFGLERHTIDANHYEYSPQEISSIQEQTGFNPKFDLGLYAMCNQEVDHQILGELTLYLAETFSGMIDFGGQLPLESRNMRGNTWEIPYTTAEGETAVYTVADVAFMKDWRSSKLFRMIK
ncbi:MAG: DUF6368 family protein [Bacteroidota bacterium]